MKIIKCPYLLSLLIVLLVNLISVSLFPDRMALAISSITGAMFALLLHDTIDRDR